MKFDITAGQLAKPLMMAAGASEAKSTLPVLANVLLQADDGRLSITGSNMETELCVTAPADIHDAGSVTINAQKFAALVKKIPDSSAMRFQLDDDKLIIRAGRSRFSLATIPADIFPAFPSHETKARIDIDADAILGLIDRTANAMGNNDVRHYLNGLYVELIGGVLRAVASDGYRLSLSECPVDGEDMPGVILPRRAVLQMAKLLTGTVSLSVSASTAMMHFEGIRFGTKLVEGRFPDYQRVMPLEIGTTITVDRKAMIETLNRVNVLAENQAAKLELDGNQLRISSVNQLNESATESMDVMVDGKLSLIAFNIKYLLDALNKIDAEQASIGITPDGSAALLSAPDDKSVRHIVMPMRV